MTPPPDPWVGDPAIWCKTIDDLARWCLDLVPEESRIAAPLYLRFLPRVVNLTVEHSGSGYKFRVGDLYFGAYQTAFKKGRLSGTLSWANQSDPNSRNPNAPDIEAEVTIHRNMHALDPANDWYRLTLSGADVGPGYADIYPLELSPFEPGGKWQGLNVHLGPPVPNPDDGDHPFPSTWWLNFKPSYVYGG
jgi:hypothetical protein